jgi:hypothetical protein
VAELRARAACWDCALSECGVIEREPGLRLGGGDPPLRLDGYQHFGDGSDGSDGSNGHPG